MFTSYFVMYSNWK